MAYRKGSYFIGSRTASGSFEERIADDRRRIRRGLEWAQSIAEEFGWDHVWLITHIRNDLTKRVNPVLVEVLGASNANALHRGKPISMGSLTMKNETLNGLLRGSIGGSILAMYPRPELLGRIDDQHMDNVVTVVPGVDDISAWVRKWNALDPDATE
jgi:hypothetical protein